MDKIVMTYFVAQITMQIIAAIVMLIGAFWLLKDTRSFNKRIDNVNPYKKNKKGDK